MAKGSFGIYRLRIQDAEFAKKTLKDLLAGLGYRASRRGAPPGRFKIVGIRGSTNLAAIANLFPMLTLFGIGSRVRATLTGGASLTEGDTEQRMSVRVMPIRETEDREETFLQSQDVGEALGDDLKARHEFRKLVDALARAGTIDV